jgi:hypothetical protein
MNNPPSSNNNNNNSNSNNRGPNHPRNSGPNRSGPHHRSRKFHRGGPRPTGGPNPNPASAAQTAEGSGSRDNRDGRNQQQQRPHPQGGGSHRPHHHRSHHSQHRNHQGGHQHGGGGIEQILIQYDKLVDQHIEARRKFHELYYRCDNNRLNKLEDQFYLTAQRILKFERELRPWQLEQLKKQRTEIYPLDTAYSSAHPEAEKNELSTDKPVVIHYHLTPDQLSRPSYKEDTEMSMGSMDDYLKYKNQA